MPDVTREQLRRLVHAQVAGLIEESHTLATTLSSELDRLGSTAMEAATTARGLAGSDAVDDGDAERELATFEGHVRARQARARDGKQAISRMTEELAAISDIVRELHEIANVGTLLAVNSAIEAARGPSGASSGLAALARESRAHAQETTGIARDLLGRVRGVEQTLRARFELSGEAIAAEEELLTGVAERLSGTLRAGLEQRRRQQDGLRELERVNAEFNLQIMDAMGLLQFQDRLAQGLDAITRLVDMLCDPEAARLDDPSLYTMASQRAIHAAVLGIGSAHDEEEHVDIELF